MTSTALEKVFWKLPYELRRTLVRTALPGRYKALQALRHYESEALNGSNLQLYLKHRCIFVHVPKTAGYSVGRSLFGRATAGHRTVAGYQTIFSKDEFESFFKFTFARNPWDRVVSAFFFCKQGGIDGSEQAWAEKHLSAFDTFDDFVRGWLNPKNIQLGRHFKPQHSYLCLPGELTTRVDFIGFYETLNDDYAYIRDTLGTGTALRAENTTKAKGRDYRSYYSNETRAIVAEVYREDIGLLGYDFDNASIDKQRAKRGV